MNEMQGVEILPLGSLPHALREHFPLRGVLRHRLEAPDHEDYRLVELTSNAITVNGSLIRHVVIWPCRGSFGSTGLPFTVGLDIVTDATLAGQETMMFDKCEPVGFAQAIILDPLAPSA